jgi:hypothetical protein
MAERNLCLAQELPMRPLVEKTLVIVKNGRQSKYLTYFHFGKFQTSVRELDR